MMSLWLMICGWREVICTFDAVQFGTAMQALQKDGIPCRSRTVNCSSASRCTGTMCAVGERMDRSTEYQIFVKKQDLPKAQLVLQGRLQSL